MSKRAVVLSGGGPVGIAWETGIAAGLAEEGVDLREADLFVGTSAGSVVGAQLALGREPREMVSAQLAPRQSGAVSAVREQGRSAPDLSGLMQVMARAAQADRPFEERLREVGALALAADTIDEEAFVAGFGARLAGTDAWPEKDFRCIAIDAVSGRFVIWDRNSRVPLARAIASSCAIPGVYPPITINERRYYDGGIRSASNADLAAGCQIVVIISLGGGESASTDPRTQLARKRMESEMSALRDAGAQTIELVTPDAPSVAAFGMNVMDARNNAGAAEAGLRQGREVAARIRQAWA